MAPGMDDHGFATGDREAQAFIGRLLREDRPDDAVLSEETPDNPAQEP